MQRISFADKNCSVAQALELVGEWWTLMIVRDALLGVTRFDELQSRTGISRNVLGERLSRLVEDGVLDLDADVSPLLGWPLRNPAFPDAPITLRLLLSHRAGLTDAAGYYAVPLDGELKASLHSSMVFDRAHWFALRGTGNVVYHDNLRIEPR